MNNLQGDNNNPLINKCKIYGNKYLKQILYQYKIINNYGNNIHKKYKYRKLVNYFSFNMDLCLYHRKSI